MPRASANSGSSSDVCACGRLRRATRSITQLYDDAMAPSRLRVSQFALLRTLSREGAKPITALAAALLLDRTALSRTLQPLVERHLVAITSGDDARMRTVSLTQAGKRTLRDARPHWEHAQRAVAARLGATRLQDLIDTLTELEALHPRSTRESQ
ncbi:MAG TPA: MarR family winged helix-turn-helix transcriptional regulator [Casimicrobiaceae bacterium]|nr:MarR family winged helix-turn-helix transcriptional regulator [Casimicrobiaceae bacterium]